MRPLPAFLALSLLALLLAPSAASADDWSLEAFLKRESPWKGHAVGSSITETKTMQMPAMPGMPNMPNMPKDGKMVTTKKSTLKQITETGYVLEVESTSMGRTTTTTRTEPKQRSVKAKLADGGQGTVTVEGTSYTCAIKTVANMEELISSMGAVPRMGPPGRDMGPTFGAGKVFLHEKLGVLRLETTTSMMGQAGTNVWQVTRLSVPRTVGSTSVNCREIEVTMASPMMNATITMLSAPSIPGSVRSEMKMQAMGMDMGSVSEVTAYIKKVATPVTR